MKKDKIIKILFITGTVLITIIFVLSVIKIYEYTLNDAKESHQRQQMEMVRAAASGIEIYLNQLNQDLQFLADFPNVEKSNLEAVKVSSNLIYNHYSEKIVTAIFFFNKNSEIIYSVGRTLPSWITSKSTYHNFHFTNNDIWFSRINSLQKDRPESGLYFVMLKPINKIEYVGFLINFDILVKKYVAPLKLGEGDFAWVLEGSGRLIYHPTHSEMLLRSITQKSDDCVSCHSSFTIQKKMIEGGASIGEYTIGDEPPKIMAYMPIELNDEKWILAVSTFLPEVTASLRGKFTLFFGLGVIILIVILSLGSLLYFTNAKKIRAEETNRLLKQRQNFQDQLNQAAKLASIGELVDSVAHEINTPLGIIASHVDALNLQKDYPPKYIEDLMIIKNQTKRINKYTKSLLNYSQRMPFNPKPQSITKSLDDCLYLLKPRFHSKQINMVNRINPELPPVFIDKDQIEQVLINILNNAFDAVDQKGEIKIEAEIEKRSVSAINKTEINYISLKITDNGMGIPNEVLEKIYDPFYTTKTHDNGTGLGLAISKAIILRHKGKIEAASEVGKYTSFKILLPLN